MNKFNKRAPTSDEGKQDIIEKKIEESKHYYTPKHQYSDSIVCEPKMTSYAECCNS